MKRIASRRMQKAAINATSRRAPKLKIARGSDFAAGDASGRALVSGMIGLGE